MHLLNFLIGLGAAVCVLRSAKGQLANNPEIHYGVIGKPLILPCISAPNTRPIQSCDLIPSRLKSWKRNASEYSAEEIIKPSTTDLQNGNCNFTIQHAAPDHIATWGCRIIFRYSLKPERSDLEFQKELTVVEAKRPNPPSITKKNSMRTLLADSWTMASNNNNTVNLKCCSAKGIPLPKLAFFLDGVLKVEKQLEMNDDCIIWTTAFHLDDNGKTLRCISTHVTTIDSNENVNQDSFVLDILHAPTIIDEDMLEKSITTYIDSTTEFTEIIVKFSSNPLEEWRWSRQVNQSYQQTHLFEEANKEHEAPMPSSIEKGIYEAVLLIRNPKLRNWKRTYTLELKNQYGSTRIDFNVTQIVIRDTDYLQRQNTSLLILSKTEQGESSTVNITCCVRTGKTPQEVNVSLLLGEDVYATGRISNETENPFCHTWADLEFNSSAHEMELNCDSEEVQDLIILVGSDDDVDEESGNSIMINISEALDLNVASTTLTSIKPAEPEVEYQTTKHLISLDHPSKIIRLFSDTHLGVRFQNDTHLGVISSPFTETLIPVRFTGRPEPNVTWSVKDGGELGFKTIEENDGFGFTVEPQVDGSWETVLTMKPRAGSTNDAHLRSITFRLELHNGRGKDRLDIVVNFVENGGALSEETDSTLNVHDSSSATETGVFYTTTRTAGPTAGHGLSSTAEPDLSSTAGPDLSSTAGPDLGSTAGPDLISTARPDLSWTASPDLRSTAGPDLGSTAGPDLSSTAGSTAWPDLSSTTGETDWPDFNWKQVTEISNVRIIPDEHTRPMILINSTKRYLVNSSIGSEQWIRVKFLSNPVGNVTWSFQRHDRNHFYTIIKNGTHFSSSVSQLPDHVWEALLIVKPRPAGSGITHENKQFRLTIENPYGNDTLEVGHEGEILPSLQYPGVHNRYLILGIILGIFAVVALSLIVFYVSKNHSLLCYENRRGSFAVKQHGCKT